MLGRRNMSRMVALILISALLLSAIAFSKGGSARTDADMDTEWQATGGASAIQEIAFEQASASSAEQSNTETANTESAEGHPASAGACTVTYAYDGAGRLVRADYGLGRHIAYGYDAAGNLVSRTTGTGERVYLPAVMRNRAP